jgi:protein-disulfide isomerase
VNSTMTAKRGAITVLVAAVASCLVQPGYAEPAVNFDSSVTDHSVIGTVGNKSVTAADIVALDTHGFDDLKDQLDRQTHLLKLSYASSYHELVQRTLDGFLDRRALELEAAARGTSTEAVLSQVKVEPVTEEQAHALYEAHKDQLQKPYEQVADEIKQYLAKQRSDAALRVFYDGLRSKNGVASALGPYRVAVAATGPARGSPSAPVTIIEFGDFQCPFCRAAETSVRALLNKYPNEVRLVFRNLPLTAVHPNAEDAARAAVCADRQGKFWEMHDVLFKKETDLRASALKTTAAQLGLNQERFAACMDEADSHSLAADTAEAAYLGIDSTPYFFIDGRPVRGNVPLENLQSVVDDELRRAASGNNRSASTASLGSH